MDLFSLELFCAVAHEQSITRAAKRLSRVQSNVTTRVKQLEEELGVQLFSRGNKRMILTSGGRTMLAYAQQLIALADEAREAVNPVQPAGVLRVGAIEGAAATYLPGLLSEYHSRWPQIELDISIGTSQSLLDDVAGGRLDCAFVAYGECSVDSRSAARFAEPGLTATSVCTEDMFLVLPSNHPPVCGPHDLRLRTIAAFPRGCTYRSALEQWLGAPEANAIHAWQVMEATSYYTILACVAAGSSFALCPTSVLDQQCAAHSVRTQQIGTIETYLVTGSGYRSGRYDALRQLVQARKRVRPVARL